MIQFFLSLSPDSLSSARYILLVSPLHFLIDMLKFLFCFILVWDFFNNCISLLNYIFIYPEFFSFYYAVCVLLTFILRFTCIPFEPLKHAHSCSFELVVLSSTLLSLGIINVGLIILEESCCIGFCVTWISVCVCARVHVHVCDGP